MHDVILAALTASVIGLVVVGASLTVLRQVLYAFVVTPILKARARKTLRQQLNGILMRGQGTVKDYVAVLNDEERELWYNKFLLKYPWIVLTLGVASAVLLVIAEKLRYS